MDKRINVYLNSLEESKRIIYTVERKILFNDSVIIF